MGPRAVTGHHVTASPSSATHGWWRGWRLIVIAVLAVVAAYSVLHSAHLIGLFLSQPVPPDWEQHRIAAERIASGSSPYFEEPWYRFRWSPVAAWLMVPITALGPWVWTAAQFGVLLLLPRALAIITLFAFPFWADVQAGNIMVFLFVAAYHAVRGSRTAALSLVALVVLVPRPLLLPLLAYVGAAHAGLRIPFSVLALVALMLAVLTGHHVEWIVALFSTLGEESHRFGAQWLPLWPFAGLAMAAALVRLRLPGTAGLAIAPYWLPYYGLLPLADRWDLVARALRGRRD